MDLMTTPSLIERVARLARPARWAIVAALMLTVVIVNRWMLVGARQARDAAAIAETAEVLYVPDTRLLRLMTLGYEQAAADLMWVRTLEYFARHFSSDRRYRWLEFFLEQVIELDPRFEKVYHWAGASVLYGRRFTTENIELSNRFYRKALEFNPDDYEAAYRIGINYYVEMPSALIREGTTDDAVLEAQREIGLEFLERAANIPAAPERMRQLVASISQRLGKQQLALQYLIDLSLQTTDPERRAALQRRLAALRAEVGDAYAEAAERFERTWRASYPYLPPAVFAVMGEPTDDTVADVNWRSLLPDVALDDAESDPPPADDAGPDSKGETRDP